MTSFLKTSLASDSKPAKGNRKSALLHFENFTGCILYIHDNNGKNNNDNNDKHGGPFVNKINVRLPPLAHKVSTLGPKFTLQRGVNKRESLSQQVSHENVSVIIK